MSNNFPIPHGANVIIATGELAKVFHNTGDQEYMTLEHVRDLTPDNLLDDGPAGKTPPEESKQDLDEATFSKQLSEYLYQQAHAGKLPRFALVADPDTLGEIRPLLHAEVEKQLLFTEAKTLINADMQEIERSLSKM
jgi:protein required for attachment to host cells